jgi:cell division protein FtsB
MADFYEQRRIKHILYSWPFLLLLGLILLLFVRATWGAYMQERETDMVKEQRAQYLADLKIRESLIRAEIERLDTERGVEEEIRQKFEVAKDGEGIIVIVDAPEDTNSSTSNTPRGFFEKMFDFFSF